VILRYGDDLADLYCQFPDDVLCIQAYDYSIGHQPQGKEPLNEVQILTQSAEWTDEWATSRTCAGYGPRDIFDTGLKLGCIRVLCEECGIDYDIFASLSKSTTTCKTKGGKNFICFLMKLRFSRACTLSGRSVHHRSSVAVSIDTAKKNGPAARYCK
jgi:hypothetical protein